MDNIKQSINIVYQTLVDLSEINLNDLKPQDKKVILDSIEQLEDVRRYLYDEINDRTIYNVR